MEQKNAAAAVGGEGKDYCSNLVFTKKMGPGFKEKLVWRRLEQKLVWKRLEHLSEKDLNTWRLEQEDLSKNLCEKDLNNGNQTPSTNSCFEQLQTLKATQFDSI